MVLFYIYKVCFVKSAPSIFETFCVKKDPISATPYHSSFNIINYASIKLFGLYSTKSIHRVITGKDAERCKDK